MKGLSLHLYLINIYVKNMNFNYHIIILTYNLNRSKTKPTKKDEQPNTYKLFNSFFDPIYTTIRLHIQSNSSNVQLKSTFSKPYIAKARYSTYKYIFSSTQNIIR